MPKTVRVEDGDCVHSIAFDHGFLPETLWELPENAKLKQLRGDPFQLQAGDELVIPDLRPLEVMGAVDQRHVFRRRGIPLSIRIRIMDFDGPRPNLPVTVEVQDHTQELTTDGEGWLEMSISPDAQRALLHIDEDETYELKLGHLDPPDTIAGVQGRLRTLGYYHGRVDGELGEVTAEALREFQRTHELEPTGEADSQTQDKLQELAEG